MRKPFNRRIITCCVLLGIAQVSCQEKRHAQEPAPGPLPYASEEITFSSDAHDIQLAGTITTPLDDTLKTAVVLINGSGRGDRNYRNQFGHRPFLVMAHYLTRQGITVLRYDERGVGKSQGNYDNATFEQLVADVAGAIHYLRDAGFKTVGLIGHSEGAHIAALTSLETDTDFLIFMGPSTTTADTNVVHQAAHRAKDLHLDEQTGREVVTTVYSLVHILKKEADPDVARKKMKDFINATMKNATPSFREASDRLGGPQKLVEGWLNPRFQYRLYHHPIESMEKVTAPALVLFGSDDAAVDPQSGIKKVAALPAAVRPDIRLFPGLNHLFMRTGTQDNDQDETIANEVLVCINEWIKSL